MKIIRSIYILLLNYLIHIRFWFKKGASIKRSVVFYKRPLIILHKKAVIQIERNVSINSDNHTYHLNMFQHCKLMADLEGALIQIGENTRVHGSCIHAQKSIRIGKNCLIAANCQIMDNNGHSLSSNTSELRIQTRGESKPIIIEDNVWIGTGVIVLPGVQIGEGSVIGANSVVSINIPKNSLAMGNPIQIIKSIA